MTTFDDTDLFSETFHDFRSVGTARRRPALVTPVVLVAAALLVAAGFVFARGGSLLADTPVDASMLLPQFAAQQTSQDRLTSDELGDLRVDRQTTRFLTETSTGRHYAAVGSAGSLCVVTVQPGELSALTCAPPTPTARVAVDDTLLVVASSGPAPAAASGWREAGPDVFVND
ncbi:hypothetical protein [Cellulomonas xylanilytica]|uniref:Uncharacterized protein n=1 Tax=Cellulomonas xylanilytica TaxID=233583 RepID=A0A510VBG1_9CELL|nr:hypothetical protein [Cellulomonas xylanilytica]GEK22495.1 hypothetical protein CXY01_30150 [Cellulomonas xylanilytica]